VGFPFSFSISVLVSISFSSSSSFPFSSPPISGRARERGPVFGSGLLLFVGVRRLLFGELSKLLLLLFIVCCFCCGRSATKSAFEKRAEPKLCQLRAAREKCHKWWLRIGQCATDSLPPQTVCGAAGPQVRPTSSQKRGAVARRATRGQSPLIVWIRLQVTIYRHSLASLWCLWLPDDQSRPASDSLGPHLTQEQQADRTWLQLAAVASWLSGLS